MAALVVIVVGVFATILLQQQASATITSAASHKKCSGDIITCTHGKKTPNHSAKDDTTPFDLPLPFP
jgi:preprotein translocase subunit SecG